MVFLYVGMSCKSSPESIQGSSASTGATEGGLISVQFYPIPSAVIPNGPGSESPKYVTRLVPNTHHVLQMRLIFRFMSTF